MNLNGFLKIDNESSKTSLDDFIESTKGLAYKKRALLWFQMHLGEIVTKDELKRIPGQDNFPISHNMRRITELRDENGFDIVNDKDNEVTGLNLKNGEYVLLNKEPNPEKVRERGVNKRIRAEVFERDGYVCQMCGRMPGDDDPFRLGHKITLHTGHKKAHKRKDGKKHHKKDLTADDFVTLCNICNEGAKNNDFKNITILDRIKELNDEKQRDIYTFLKEKFE